MEKIKLTTDISVKDFEENYWLKTELMEFCKSNQIKAYGAKLEIIQRIKSFLLTGKTNAEIEQPKNKVLSKFDWHSAQLTLDTIITDNYKNTQNVRRFFTEEIGNKFHFNIEFMNYMKSNVGKTLKDAIQYWLILDKDTNKKEIPPQFEYNTYIRDFLKDNQDKTLKEARIFWNIKKLIPGSKKYSKNDLLFDIKTEDSKN